MNNGNNDNSTVTTNAGVQQSYQQYTPRPACHVGPRKVFTIGKVNVWAGSYKEVDGDWEWDFMLRLGDERSYYSNPSPVTANESAKAVFKEGVLGGDLDVPAVLDIHWPDFSRPHLGKAWWKNLYEEIKSWPEGDMVVHCMGGHGRTGTALAILAGLNGETQPVAFVRQNYCKEVVESDEQIRYIRYITGLDVTDEPAGILGWTTQRQGYYGNTQPTMQQWKETYPHYDPQMGRFYRLVDSKGIIYREFSDGTLMAETEGYLIRSGQSIDPEQQEDEEEDEQDWNGPSHRASVT